MINTRAAVSSARMRLLGRRVRKPVASHVRVDLRRSDIGVAEQLLDRSQVRTTVEEMRRERVAKRMGMQRASVGERESVQDPTRVTRREALRPRAFTKSASVGFAARPGFTSSSRPKRT